MTRKKERDDAAERWLRENDPQYAQRSKSWRTRSDDALEHGRKKSAPPHGSLVDLIPLEEERRPLAPGARGIPAALGSGNYARRSARESDDE